MVYPILDAPIQLKKRICDNEPTSLWVDLLAGRSLFDLLFILDSSLIPSHCGRPVPRDAVALPFDPKWEPSEKEWPKF